MKTSAVNTCESLLAQQKGAFKLRYGCRVRPRGVDAGPQGIVVGRRQGEALIHWRPLGILRWCDTDDLEIVASEKQTGRMNRKEEL